MAAEATASCDRLGSPYASRSALQGWCSAIGGGRAAKQVVRSSLDPRCVEMDRDSTARLVPLITRNRAEDPPVIARAINALTIARRHCAYGWIGRAQADYRWLADWIVDHR